MSDEFGSPPEDNALSELLDLSMPANSEEITRVVDNISQTLTRLEVPEQKRFEVELAVSGGTGERSHSRMRERSFKAGSVPVEVRS
jgi:hypothetical protein